MQVCLRWHGQFPERGHTESGKNNCTFEESHQLLQNTFHKALSKGQGTGLKYRFESENMDLLTVMPAIAIPTIPTKCRLASITFWISTRQFY